MIIDIPETMLVSMLMKEYEIYQAPSVRQYNVDHLEICIPIGSNHTATLTMDKMAFQELEKITGLEIPQEGV